MPLNRDRRRAGYAALGFSSLALCACSLLAPGAAANGCTEVIDPYGVPGLRNQVGPCGAGMGYTQF